MINIMRACLMMFYPFFIDYWYLVLIVLVMIISAVIQVKLRSTYHKYAQVLSARGYTGAQMAEKVLRDHEIYDVRVEPVRGELTDHYSPKEGVIRLSQNVYGSTSVAALGIACHEAGHAVQHQQKYFPLALRNAFIPVVNFSSSFSWLIVLLGLVLSYPILIDIGLILFAAVAVFQLITLPVEFNASQRAITVLRDSQVLSEEELRGTKKVLRAAAMTYVAALAMSIVSWLRLFLLTRNRRD